MIDINELRRLAQAAKNSCESVEWSHEFRSGRYSQGEIISGEENILIVCGANYGCWRDADDDGDSQFKALGDFVAAANPAAISELLDRLEAAESDALEQARLNGMGGEREAALIAKLEAAEKERDALRAAVRHEADCVEACKSELAQLRKDADKFGDGIDWIQRALQAEARIEAMERQEPVAWLHESRRDSDVVTDAVKHVWGKAAVGSMAAYSIPLYALPGAQPAPSVPDGWQLVPDKHPTFDPVDLQFADGSVLCGCVPQVDGDYWWEGPSGEVFIDTKYANVTHWRLAAAPKQEK